MNVSYLFKYAEAHIPKYWIVIPQKGIIEVYLSYQKTSLMKTLQLFFFFLYISTYTNAQISPTDSDYLIKAILKEVNQLRSSKGLKPLQNNMVLRKAAKMHSVYLAETNTLSHVQESSKFETPKKRVAHFKGKEFELVGENVLKSAEINFPFNKSTLNRLAKDLFQAWKGSPGHYANMIDPSYEFSGLDFQMDTSNKFLFVTQVFGTKGVKIDGQLSPNAFGLKEHDSDCGKLFNNFDNIIANMGNAIHIDGNKVLFYYHNLYYFNKIFDHELDGLAIDLVTKDQMICGGPNQMDFSPIHDGILLPPVYKNDILKNNSAQSDYRIISEVGTVPDFLLGKELYAAVVLIKEGKKCKYLLPGDVPSKPYQLRSIEPKLFEPQKVQLKKEGIVESQQLYYEFDTDITTPAYYPKLQSTSNKVHSVEITSYSSIEGSTKRNTQLHNARAQSIKNHLKKKLNLDDTKITINAKENWETMDFQLKYFFADHLSALSKEELKAHIASGDQSLAWDSLLAAQRTSVATVHYYGKISETGTNTPVLKANLRTAIAMKDYDLANLAMLELYQTEGIEELFLGFLFSEPNLFEALKRELALVQNAAALLTKASWSDPNKLAELLHHWVRQKEDLSQDAINNVLLLYAMFSDQLINVWDLPSKRLSNVVHPRRVKDVIDDQLANELVLNLHLTFIKYFGQINDGQNISESFDFIVHYFQSRLLDKKDEIDLVLFFNNWSMYGMTNYFLLKKFDQNQLNEDEIFILMKTLDFFDNERYLNRYEQVHRKALAINSKRWCNWINQSFQLLTNNRIKNLYCQKCK